jgi:hypothetical protein
MTSYTVTAFSPTIGYQQPGSQFSYYPPDNALAVGPSNVVMVENSSIEWGAVGASSTLGGVSAQTLTSFFHSLSPYGMIFDPRATYDATNGRFVVVADEVSSNFSKSSLVVAVSRDSNPADGWYFESINSTVAAPNGSRSTSTWADYPTLAVDGQNIIISTNQFTAGGSYAGSYQFVLHDFIGTNGGLFKGGSSTEATTKWGGSFATVQEVSAPGALGSYGVSYTGNGLAVAFNSQSGAATKYQISLGAIDAGTSSGYKASQPGSSWSLDAGDGRVTSATYANGKLFAVFEVNTGTTSSPAPAVHWVELNTSALGTAGAVVAQGNITMAGAVTFNPSVAVDANGDAIINFTASGKSLYATDYFAAMPAGGTNFSVPIAYQTSASTAYAQGSGSVSRWGDYSSAVANPNNPAGFWLSNEFAASSSSWGTALDQVTLGTGSQTLSFLAPTTGTTGHGPTTTTLAAPSGDTPVRIATLSDLFGGIDFADLTPSPGLGNNGAAASGLFDLSSSAGSATAFLSNALDQWFFSPHSAPV